MAPRQPIHDWIELISFMSGDFLLKSPCPDQVPIYIGSYVSWISSSFQSVVVDKHVFLLKTLIWFALFKNA